MPPRIYHLVNVFTQDIRGGNPLAIFTLTEPLSSASMQLIANQMNLSETVFIQPQIKAEAIINIRIFTQ